MGANMGREEERVSAQSSRLSSNQEKGKEKAREGHLVKKWRGRDHDANIKKQRFLSRGGEKSKLKQGKKEKAMMRKKTRRKRDKLSGVIMAGRLVEGC